MLLYFIMCCVDFVILSFAKHSFAYRAFIAHTPIVRLVKEETKVLNVDDWFFFSPPFASFNGLSNFTESVSIPMSLHSSIFRSNFKLDKRSKQKSKLQ